MIPMENLLCARVCWRVLAVVFKIFAILTAIYMLVYGLGVGIIGIDPGGGRVTSWWRILGLVALIYSVLYCLPNGVVVRSRQCLRLYMALTLMPTVAMLVAVIGVSIECGLNDLVRNAVHYLQMVPFVVSAPVSAICAARVAKTNR
jgi:hypothetical protein